MRMSSRNMKKYFEKKVKIPCNESGIQKAVLKSKRAYYDFEMEKTLSKAEFLYQQSKYIKKCWWVFQGLLLILLWLLLKYAGSGYYDRRNIGMASPLFVLLIIPEIWKNKSANALEVEGTTLYSIRQVYAARLILFTLVDLVLLSLFFIAASYAARMTLMEPAIQFFVPFNVTCCICFRMLYSKRINEELICSMSEKVWSLETPKAMVDSYLKKYKVSNIKTVRGGAELRILAEKRPAENANLETASLEDVFLFYFGEKAGDDDA